MCPRINIKEKQERESRQVLKSQGVRALAHMAKSKCEKTSLSSYLVTVPKMESESHERRGKRKKRIRKECK